MDAVRLSRIGGPDDVRVIQFADHAHFVQEVVYRLDGCVHKQFHGYRFFQAQVPRPKHGSVCTGANLFQQLVIAQTKRRRKSHRHVLAQRRGRFLPLRLKKTFGIGQQVSVNSLKGQLVVRCYRQSGKSANQSVAVVLQGIQRCFAIAAR